MAEPIIQVTDIGKSYRLGKIGTTTFMDEVSDRWSRLFGGQNGKDKVPQAGERPPALDRMDAQGNFWALRNVSFEVREGEVLGIIGRNGAGKSTLLKLLARITEPTEGSAIMHGRVASLLEVGTGFHPDLTGRENVFLNGAILGMRRREIAAKFDQIVEFSGVEQFIDTPVKRYSSGMRVRLAFAVAAHLDPEILIIDEVLSVGDLAFQQKCLGKMKDVTGEGRTVLFVSHVMESVRALCHRCVLLEGGTVELDTTPTSAINRYREIMKSIRLDDDSTTRDTSIRRGGGQVRFEEILVLDGGGNGLEELEPGEDVVIEMSFKINERVENLYAAVALRGGPHQEQITSLRCTLSKGPLEVGKGKATIRLKGPPLRVGEYEFYFWMGDQMAQPYDVVEGIHAPLVVNTKKTFDELGYKPSKPQGYFNIQGEVTHLEIGGRSHIAS